MAGAARLQTQGVRPTQSGLNQEALEEPEAKLLLTEGVRAFPRVSEDTQIFSCQNES